jgi:tRNA A37 threonylcarbamoyladenosine dehydratase
MEEIYNRQQDIPLNTNLHVAVIGCGGIGFWAARFLAMSGVPEFTLFDNDTIETSNLNRLDLSMDMLGKNKADVVKSIIGIIRPGAYVKSVPFKFKDEYLTSKPDFILDCTDHSESQEMISRYAKDNGIKYLKAGYDGTHMTLANKIPKWGESQGGYVITPSWVVPAVVVAALAVGAVTKYFGKELSLDLEQMYRQ